MNWNNNPGLLSQPVRLYWNGWESNTYKLQNNGWELSAMQDTQNNKMQIAFRHVQAGVRGMSENIDFDYSLRHKHQQHLNCTLGHDLIVQIQDDHLNSSSFNPKNCKEKI